MNVKPLHNIWSIQSTRSALTQTEHLRRSPCKSDHERDDRPDLNAKTPSNGSAEGFYLDCSKPQRHIFSHAYRRVTCVLSCNSSEACAGTITSGGQNGRRLWQHWSAEMEYVWHTQQGIGGVIGDSVAKAGSFQLGLSSKSLFRQERHSVSGVAHGDDFALTGPTERLTRFGTEMAGVHPSKTKIISNGSSESIIALNRMLRLASQHDPRHVDVPVKDLGIEHCDSVQTPATYDATEEEPEPTHPVHVASCKIRESSSTQQSLAKMKRLVGYLKRERTGAHFQLWKNGRRSDNIFKFRLRRLQRKSKVIKRWR